LFLFIIIIIIIIIIIMVLIALPLIVACAFELKVVSERFQLGRNTLYMILLFNPKT